MSNAKLFKYGNSIIIKYDYLIKNCDKFLKYAFRTCDSFALLFEADRPYKEGYVEASQEVHLDLKKYLIKQHPPSSRFYERIQKGHILNQYHCNRQTKDIILSLNNIFDYNYEEYLPEDIKFYRNNKLWFSSVSHERTAVIDNATEQDISFLIEMDNI